MPEKFHVGNKLLIIKDKEVLLLQGPNSQGKTVWDLPGGRMEATESVEEGLMREVEEELPGISDIKVFQPIATFKLPDRSSDNTQIIINIFSGAADTENIKLSDEHTAMEWVNKKRFEEIQENSDAILYQPFIQPIKQALEHLEEKN